MTDPPAEFIGAPIGHVSSFSELTAHSQELTALILEAQSCRFLSSPLWRSRMRRLPAIARLSFVLFLLAPCSVATAQALKVLNLPDYGRWNRVTSTAL